MKRSVKCLTVVALIASLLIAGCANSTDASRRRESAREEAPVETVAAHNAAITEGLHMGDAAAADYELSTEGMSYAIEEPDSDPVARNSSTTAAPEIETSDRMLIRYVTLSCETLRFSELTTGIEAQVSALGGYIENKTMYGTGNNNDLRTATYVIRVSSESLDALVNTIGSAAVITSTNESTEDVTLSYADTQARIESLRVEQETLNNLLAEADDLDIILQLQNELTNVRYQIESYESQLRVLENLSSYSTLTLTITEVLEETEPEEPHIKTYSERVSEAFHSGLDSAKETLEDIGISIAENAIGIAVFLVIAIVVIVIAVRTIKKRKNSSKKIRSNKPVEKGNEPSTQDKENDNK